MKRLIIFICCILYVPTAAVAGVTNIKHMSRNYNDSFDVICLNGTLETVNPKTILDNSVCNTTTNKFSPASKSVTCTGNEFMDRFYITRISDGKRLGDLGDSSSLKACQQAVKASSSEVVCTGDGFMNRFYITRISDGKKLGNPGDSSSLQTCLQLSSGRE
jgi:hypothetical protein